MYEFTTEMTNVVKTKSSVHFSPKKAYPLLLNTRKRKKTSSKILLLLKRRTKLKKQDTYHKNFKMKKK